MPSPMDFSWLQLFAAALGGGVTVKAIDIVYQEIRRRQDTTQTASRFIDEHLDPLLKSADELVGKLHSLATEDFRSLHRQRLELTFIDNSDFGSLLYLFSRFWARIEIFKQEGLSVAIAKDQRGAHLQSFMACLESRKMRIVDRISQRAIGELLTKPAPDYLRHIGYVEFIRAVEANPEVQRWISPLATILSRTAHSSDRQQLLKYGIVTHAMIDTLDPRHIVTANRPSYPGKLTDVTRKDLKYRVFSVYLPFVPNREKYMAGNKSGPEKG